MSNLDSRDYFENVLVLNLSSVRDICQRLDIPEPQPYEPIEPIIYSILDRIVGRIESLEYSRYMNE